MTANNTVTFKDHRTNANVSFADIIQWISKFDEKDGAAKVKADLENIRDNIIAVQADRPA